jgi:hypothetical protein
VDEREADERYTRLVSNMAEARDLLKRAGEGHWATWMAAVHADLTARDAQGLTRLLRAYGGMGCFNDVVIDPVNGNAVRHDDCDLINTSLASLRTAMHTDAQALLHDFERTG